MSPEIFDALALALTQGMYDSVIWGGGRLRDRNRDGDQVFPATNGDFAVDVTADVFELSRAIGCAAFPNDEGAQYDCRMWLRALHRWWFSSAYEPGQPNFPDRPEAVQQARNAAALERARDPMRGTVAPEWVDDRMNISCQ